MPAAKRTPKRPSARKATVKKATTKAPARQAPTRKGATGKAAAKQAASTGKTAPPHFSARTFTFFKELEANNRKPWFDANKPRYEADVKAPMLAFIEALQPGLKRISKHVVADPKPVGGSMFRIHRDIRFAKDKSPYKTFAAARFAHDGTRADGKAAPKDAMGPGFYFSIGDEGIWAAGGMWHPDARDLQAVREAIRDTPARWQRVLDASGVKELEGEALKRPPKGFDADTPYLEHIKQKDFIATMQLARKVATGPDLVEAYLAECKRLAPLAKFTAEAAGWAW